MIRIAGMATTELAHKSDASGKAGQRRQRKEGPSERMAESAALLVEEVFPREPMRNGC